MFRTTLLLRIIFVCLLTGHFNSIKCQVHIDTLAISEDFISYIDALEDRVAWFSTDGGEEAIFLLQNEIRDTIELPQGTSVDKLVLTNDLIAWDAIDKSPPSFGHCSLISLNGLTYNGSITQSWVAPCSDSKKGDGYKFVRIYFEDSGFYFEVRNNQNQILFDLQDVAPNNQINVVANFSIGDSIIFFQAFGMDDMSNYTDVIYSLNINSQEVQLIFETTDRIYFTNQSNDYSLTFEVETQNSLEKYYYNNGYINMVSSEIKEIRNFKEGILFIDETLNYPSRGLISYEKNGNIDTITHEYWRYDINECFVGWKVHVEDNGVFKTKYSISNGVSTRSVILEDGQLDIDFVMYDDKIYDFFTNSNGKTSLIRMDFNLPCIECTGIDIIVQDEESHISGTWIQSNIDIVNSNNVSYQARSFVELNPEFNVPNGVELCVQISECGN